MLRPKPFPQIFPRKNKSVMDVHLNNYDVVFVKPLADKLDGIKPLTYVKPDGSQVDVDRIVVSDPSRASYDAGTKTLTLNVNVSGVTSFTDLIGVPNRLPLAAEMDTDHTDPNAGKTTMFLVAREDGIYFENHVTGVEVEPRRSKSRGVFEEKFEALERRIAELESQLK